MSNPRNKRPLRDTLDIADFRNLKFGCLPARSLHLPLRGETDDRLAGFVVREHYPIVASPADAQTLGSCTCNAFTGLVETQIYATHGEIVSLDYDRLYRLVRTELYGDQEDNGAQLIDPYIVAVNHGLLPKGAVAPRPNLRMAEICAALARGPIVIGMSVHEGWAPKNLHAENGAVDESKDSDLQQYANGHAMLLVGTNRHNDCDGLVLRQSWGPIGIDGAGLVFVSAAHFIKWAIDLPVAIELPPDWKSFRGWEDWVLK
jgi:hypothetical protein